MAPPVTTAGYGGYSSQPPATSAYSYENPMQPMNHASQHPSYPTATQAQRVEVTHAQNVSPSMAHLPHHQQHAQQHTQRPPVGYGMPGYHHTMAPSGYPTYASVHADYRRADPTSGSLPSMRTLDQASSMSGPMAHSQHMMMMQSHEMNYYPHMMAQQYGMHPEMLGRYPLTHDPRFALTRTPKKEIKRRTKTGCMTCRKRRIKCDETHPTCNNCKKSKRECLGYDPIFKQQNQGQPAPHLHQPQANLSPSQKSVKQSPGQQSSTSQSPSQQHTTIKQEPLPPLQQQSSQIQSNSRPSSQQMQSSSMGPASTTSMSSSSIHSTSSHMSNQLPTTPSTQSSYKATPPLSSNYPTPTSTSVSASSYDNNIQSHSPGHGNSYDYQNIDPALANGSAPRPYQSHEPHHQPRMDHIPQMRQPEAAPLL